jgi:predicted component of type VI protein secretion system
MLVLLARFDPRDLLLRFGPLHRERVCRALALLHVEGISDASAHDMKSALYHRAVLNSNLWNAMLVLLARFDPRDLLLRFGQAAQVLSLDVLKAERS